MTVIIHIQLIWPYKYDWVIHIKRYASLKDDLANTKQTDINK